MVEICKCSELSLIAQQSAVFRDVKRFLVHQLPAIIKNNQNPVYFALQSRKCFAICREYGLST
jgi:hypothetical protein